MNQGLVFFYNLLNKKTAYWLIISIATISKSILTWIFSNYEGDKSFYLLLAKNLGSGHGFTIPVSLLSNPTVTDNVYIPSAISPLYSILAVPLLKIFPGNYVLVTWLIESSAWLLLFLVLHKLLSLLIPGRFWPNLFILFSGFFLYNIELSSSSKDILATSLIFLALFRCIKITNTNDKIPVSYLAVSSFLFWLPGLTKFFYLPLAIVFPLSILFIGMLNKERKFFRAGLISLIISSLLVGAHYLYFHSLETEAMIKHASFYSNRWSLAKGGDDFIAGFYPVNLLLLYPYIPAAVINLDVIGIQVRAVVPHLYRSYGIILSVLNVAGIIGLASFFFYCSRRYFRKAFPPQIIFFLCGTIISFAILFLTSAYSVRYHAIEYKGSGSSWTYVFENRPFIFSILFVQLLIVIFIFSRKQRKPWLSITRIVLLCVLGLGFFHGLYFVLKSSFSPNQVNQKSFSVNRLVVKDADSIGLSNPGYKIWVATEMQHLDWYAKLQDQKLLNHVAFLNDSSFKLPPRTILLTAITKEDTARIGKYLQRKDIGQLRNYNNAWFIYLQRSE